MNIDTPKNCTVIADMQFGSTGKGLIAGYLAERDKPTATVTAWSANAGHTYIDGKGRKFVHTMLANGVVSPELREVFIGPGSLIDIHALMTEVEDCANLLENRRIIIHPAAAQIQPWHRSTEKKHMVGIGSTMKGCGAALIDKIRRPTAESNVVSREHHAEQFALVQCLANMAPGLDVVIAESNMDYIRRLSYHNQIQVEGAQGYSLGINSGFYPYTTSRECTFAQILTDCGVPQHWVTNKVGTLRSYPIRVANRYDEEGNQIGWSGPCYPDQIELDWSDIGVDAEITTVTKLPRRIFSFSMMQLEEALIVNQPDELFLNFANYLSDEGLRDLRVLIEDAVMGHVWSKVADLRYIGYGATANDVRDLLSKEI